MNTGKTLFAQLMDFLPWTTFTRIVDRYGGDHRVRTLSCAEQYRSMAFAQLTCRESLRDIETCLSVHASKLYHMGFRQPVRRSTLADANERRDWRIHAALAQRLITQARTLYVDEELGLDLTNTVYALDSTTIALCLSVFPWAHFRTTKAAVKMHTLLDLRGNIPSFIHISDGKLHDVHALDMLLPEAGAIYVVDRGYVDFAGPGPRDPGHQGGGHVAAVLTGEAGSPVCALKEAVHALCPVFLLDVDQGLEFAQVMGVAGAVAHALEGEVGGVIVMDEDAFEVLFDIAASRADAQDGQEWGAQHVEPAGTGGDPQAGFVEVLDRNRCADHVCDMGEEGLEAPGGSPAHGGDRGCGDGHCEEVAHEFGQALLGNELGVQQVAHPGGDAWPVLDRGGHAVREDGSCHGGAGAAEAAMGAVFVR